MSSNQYSITIKNESNYGLKFFMYLDISLPSNAPPEEEIFRSVYATSPRVPSGDGGQITFTMQPDFFAVSGASRVPLGSGARIRADVSMSISLGQKCGTLTWMTAPEGNPQWVKDKSSRICIPGGFGVQTDTTFRYPNDENIFIGMGARDPSDSQNIIPVQTFLARPNLRTAFFPTIRYVITTGDYQPGTIFDSSQIGASLEVDFERTNTLRNLVFTYNDRGEYVADEQTKEAGGFVVRDAGEEPVVDGDTSMGVNGRLITSPGMLVNPV